MLEHGNIQRLEAGQHDPRDRDDSIAIRSTSRRFTGGTQTRSSSTVRERYLWELHLPRADDPLYATQHDEYRSELFDRLATPLYPPALIILTFMFLGPPQTTRQSRTLALLGP